MGTFRESITEKDKEWISRQKVYFVSTAPLAKNGHVNVSPKGYDSLRIVDSNRVLLLDGRGSGCETVAHLRENGRITVMMTAFEGGPRIMRLFGLGKVHEPGSPEFETLFEQYYSEEWKDPEKHKVVRTIIDIDVTLVGQACGFSIPLMEYKADRDTFIKYNARRSKEQLLESLIEDNTTSIDGIPSYLNNTNPGAAAKLKQTLGEYLVGEVLPWLGGAVLGASITLAIVKSAYIQ